MYCGYFYITVFICYIYMLALYYHMILCMSSSLLGAIFPDSDYRDGHVVPHPAACSNQRQSQQPFCQLSRRLIRRFRHLSRKSIPARAHSVLLLMRKRNFLRRRAVNGSIVYLPHGPTGGLLPSAACQQQYARKK